MHAFSHSLGILTMNPFLICLGLLDLLMLVAMVKLSIFLWDIVGDLRTGHAGDHKTTILWATCGATGAVILCLMGGWLLWQTIPLFAWPH